ncbi:hypothetical protein RFI_34400 [Reticulomyxa filosa]|uniref:Uncharacterized protein n=1 Tax=Reticulomyxa filosa TaxID=46433 RepID=X6LQI9_RETFI|nr:hypothetical protein RFI_34400 [Reticulomyxa filosa]|eukprot:ETO03010.1 hypothetical protein RFI_34400 [Reticulomyxa filosa]
MPYVKNHFKQFQQKLSDQQLDRVFSAFIYGLKDKYIWGRELCAESLGVISKKLNEKQLENAINALINGLKDKDRDVRGSYVGSLGIIAAKASEEQLENVFNALISGLKDEDNIAHRSCKLLGVISEKLNEKQLENAINTLIDGFKGKYRLNRTESLGKQLKKVLIENNLLYWAAGRSIILIKAKNSNVKKFDEGCDSFSFLTFRIFLLFEICIGLRQVGTSQMRLPRGSTFKQVYERGVKELRVQLTTYWDYITVEEFEHKCPDLMDDWSCNVVSRLINLKSNLCCEMRLVIGHEGHCVYLGLCKILDPFYQSKFPKCIQSVKEIDNEWIQFHFDTYVFQCQVIPSLSSLKCIRINRPNHFLPILLDNDNKIFSTKSNMKVIAIIFWKRFSRIFGVLTSEVTYHIITNSCKKQQLMFGPIMQIDKSDWVSNKSACNLSIANT